VRTERGGHAQDTGGRRLEKAKESRLAGKNNSKEETSRNENFIKKAADKQTRQADEEEGAKHGKKQSPPRFLDARASRGSGGTLPNSNLGRQGHRNQHRREKLHISSPRSRSPSSSGNLGKRAQGGANARIRYGNATQDVVRVGWKKSALGHSDKGILATPGLAPGSCNNSLKPQKRKAKIARALRTEFGR